ncbi:MAG TPA: gamma-glutamylcyclotransferase family protein [Opitutaceae bacterium]|nr:gamma-glutamylcyclotransferase family protein [Opitutaceae bacterium]
MSDRTPAAQSALLFVYGTLRRGQPNHRQLLRLGARFLGPAVTLRPLRLGRAADGLPVLYATARDGLRGELYAVDMPAAWTALDEFEGHPAFYRRHLDRVRRPGGTEAEAWLYFRGG